MIAYCGNAEAMKVSFEDRILTTYVFFELRRLRCVAVVRRTK